MHFWQELYRIDVVSSLVHHIGKHMVMFTLITWLRWCLPVFSTVRFLFFSLLWKSWRRTLRFYKYLFLIILVSHHTLILASIDESCLKKLLVWCLPDDDFLFVLFLQSLLAGNLL